MFPITDDWRYLKKKLGPLSSVIVVLVWISAIVGLLQLFWWYDWEQGKVRGVVLLVLMAWVSWPLIVWGSVVLTIPRSRPLTSGVLLLCAFGLASHVVTGIKSALLTRKTRYILMDQGQNSYRAIRLLRRGVNPYGQRTMLDMVEYELKVRTYGLGHPEVKYIADPLQAQEKFWRTLDPAQMTLVFPTIDKTADPRIQRDFSSLGYKYGPVLLVAYYPFVFVFDQAGIFVAHVMWLLVLVVVLWHCNIHWLRGRWLLLGIPFAVLFIPPHLRHNVLFCSASDLIPITLAMIAMDLLQHRKFEWGAFVLGLSAVAKLLPAVLFAPLLLAAGSLRPMALFFGVVLSCFLPFVLWDATGVWNNIVLFNLVRPTDSTSLMHYLVPGLGLAVIFMAGGSLLGLLMFLNRHHWPPLGQWHYLVVVLILACLCGKIFHNNYLVWLLPVLGTYALALIGGLAAPPSREPTAKIT